MNPRLLRLTRILELIGATAILLMGLWMWLHMFLADPSNGAKAESDDSLAYLVLPLLLVAPGVIVVVGAYLQTIRRKRWPVVFVLIGGVWALIFVGINMAFAFLYIGDKWGARVVFTDLLVVALTISTAMINAFFQAKSDTQPCGRCSK